MSDPFSTKDEAKEAIEIAVEAVNSNRMSIRKAAAAFNVSKGKIHRRTSGQVEVTARNGTNKILKDEEIQGILDSVDARIDHGQCFTIDELGLFIRRVVEESPYTREIPVSFPSSSWVSGFIREHSARFGRRRAQNLDMYVRPRIPQTKASYCFEGQTCQHSTVQQSHGCQRACVCGC